MSWHPIAANEDMETAAVIMSGSLAASVAGIPFPAPPVFPEGIDRLYTDAQKSYDGLAVRDRLVRQIQLTATGNLEDDIDAPYGLSIHQAASLFQAEHGREPTGRLDDEETQELALRSAKNLTEWRFALTPHPTQGRAIWLPRGMALKSQIVGQDLRLANDEGLSILYQSRETADMGAAFVEAHDAAKQNGGAVLAAVVRSDYYQLLSADADGEINLIQQHRHGAGLLGVRITWQRATKVPMERIVALVGASLRHEMAGRAFPTPDEALARPLRQTTAPAEPSEPTPSKKGAGGGTGTGFFVSADGHVLTNHHVAGSCGSITVQAELGAASSATLIASDPANDMALLKTSFKKKTPAPFRESLRVGEGVAAFGYPLAGMLTSTGNFTLGNVAALEGIGDDERFNQVTTPVQPGNSGGPLVDMSGAIAGVVTLKLNAARFASLNGDIPQNVNFALKPALAADFLRANGLKPAAAPLGAALTPSELAERARDMSILIYCLP